MKAWLRPGCSITGCLPKRRRERRKVASCRRCWRTSLHGLEEHIRTRFPARTRRNPEQPGRQLHWQPQVIGTPTTWSYSQGPNRDEQCRQLTQEWLQGIGLELSEQKTRIAHTLEKVEGEAGFNFLGFQVRQYHASKYNTSRGRGFKTLITPSPEAVKRHWARLSELISQNKAAKQANLIGVLNPVIAGWANYYSAVVSTKTFHRLDHRLYEKLRRWAFFRHPRKVGGGRSAILGHHARPKLGVPGETGRP